MTSNGKVLVAGAGGFIGGHLVRHLVKEGAPVKAVDRKPLKDWYQVDHDAENKTANLEDLDACRKSVHGVEVVYNLAADMGGMGFIERNKALCMLSVLESTHILLAARDAGVARFFYASSACVYAAARQRKPDAISLREGDAYPADAEDGYGWEKLFTERMCRHFLEDFGVQTRVARYHNVYGPLGTWMGGREKAPAAICRKVAEAALNNGNQINIWGDGEQSRSFMYIDDCIKGTQLITNCAYPDPTNLGSSELVTINELVDIVETIAGISLKRSYDRSAPQGVRGRNSDNTLMFERYGWEPDTTLLTGLELTYRWVYDQVAARQGRSSQ